MRGGRGRYQELIVVVVDVVVSWLGDRALACVSTGDITLRSMFI